MLEGEEEVIQDGQQAPVEEKIDYEAKYKDLESKYKDVDLDRWAAVKDIDPDDFREASDLRSKLMADKGKFDKVLAILQEQKEEAEAAGDDKASDEIGKRLERLEKQLAAQAEEKQQQAVQSWMQKYDTSLEGTLKASLSGEFKALGELTPFEQKAVKGYVDSVFEADKNSKKPKLTLNDVERVTKEAIKEIQDNRSVILGKSVKRDGSPDPLKGGSGDALPKPGPVTPRSRIDSMKRDFASSQATNIIT